MGKQALVIGLGRFGMSLAHALTERGVEVLAADSRDERVREASNFVAEAARFDATDAEALERTSPSRRDVCICTIGDDSTESAIICTALLRQMGARRVIARSNSPLQSRILKLVGAHEIVNPLQEFGERFANLIAYDRVIGELPLGEDLLITELKPPPSFAGRTLAELSLPQRFGVTVIALRQQGTGTVILPRASDRLSGDDILIVISREEALARLMEQS